MENFRELPFSHFSIQVDRGELAVNKVMVDGRNFHVSGILDGKYDADLCGVSKVDINSPDDLREENWEDDWCLDTEHIELKQIFDELDAMEARKKELEVRIMEIRKGSLAGQEVTVQDTRFKISLQRQTKKNKNGTRYQYADLVATGSPYGRFCKIRLGKVYTLDDAQRRIAAYLDFHRHTTRFI